MRLPDRRSLAALGASVTVVVAAAVGLIVGAPNSIAVQSARVIALPVPKAKVTVEMPVQAAPAPRGIARYVPADECPQMNNRGGGLQWIPSSDAGPWPTDGRIQIPALGTAAPIVRVGVDRRGQMVVPPGAGQVAWLDQGGIPGRTNNIVIAGHISWSGVPGAFERIGSLAPGDTVVLTLDGKRMTFRISWVCSFVRTSPEAARIMGYTDSPSLTLITCGGGWDSYAGTHTNRIVAHADLVDQESA